jgi:hypothetical protein
MLTAAVAYVWRFGSNVPFWDEWNMVPAVTGHQPITLDWLWAPHNGHRIPFPRLVLLGLYRISHVDFRVGMYFNVAGLGGAAAMLIWASQRIRGGRASVTDAIFPLLLLSGGHYDNLLWSWQVTQMLPIIVVCSLLAVIAAYGFMPTASGAALAIGGVITLPLSGVPGLAYAPALAGWLTVAAWVAYREGWRSRATAMWIAAAVTFILVGLYFNGYTSHTSLVLLAQPRAVLKTAVKFAAGGLGPISGKIWPASGAVTAVTMLTTGIALIWTSVRRGSALDCAKALLVFLVGGLCLVVAFAIGRTNVGFISRYFALASPLWCAAFLAWPLCVKPAIARSAQIFLLAILIFATPLNVFSGLRYARDYHRRMEAFRADLLAGASPEELVAHHAADLCPCAWSGFADAGLHQQWGNLPWDTGFPATHTVSFHKEIAANLHNLQRAQIGDYARMRVKNPPMREIVPTPENGFTIGRAMGGNDAADPAKTAVLLTPNKPLYVLGVRIQRPSGSQYVSPNDVWGHGDVKGRWVQVFWRLPGESAYMAPNRYVFLWEPGKDEQIVWIFRRVDQIAFHVGDRGVQRRLGARDLPLTLLLPDATPTTVAHVE